MTATATQQTWPPKAGQQVNYYGSKAAFHGAAKILHGPYRLAGSGELHYDLDSLGDKLKHVRLSSLHPLYRSDVTPEAPSQTWCAYCGTTKPVNKTRLVRVHLAGERECRGSRKPPRYTVAINPQSPHRDRPWTVTDNCHYGMNMRTANASSAAERDGWYATYQDARDAASAREAEGYTLAGQCDNCASDIETDGFTHRHVNDGRSCLFHAGKHAEPAPQYARATEIIGV